MEDPVNNPNHYRQSSTETIDIIKASMTTEEYHDKKCLDLNTNTYLYMQR